MKQTPETIVLLNFVCEDIQKIARGIRAKNIYTMVMPFTVGNERLLQEKPAGLIVCADENAPGHVAELARFQALGMPLLCLTVKKDSHENEIAKAVEFCIGKCGCHGLWKLENFVDEAVADIRS